MLIHLCLIEDPQTSGYFFGVCVCMCVFFFQVENWTLWVGGEYEGVSGIAIFRERDLTVALQL